MNWGGCHVGLDGDGIGIGLTFCHLWPGQRLELRFDEVNLFHSTVDSPTFLEVPSGCTLASRVSFPADGAHSLSVIRTGWVAEAVLFDVAGWTAFRRDTSSTILAELFRATSTVL